MKFITIRVSSWLKQAVELQCKKKGITITKFVKDAIIEWLAKNN